MDRQRTFPVLLFLAAVTVFSACGVSGDEPGDDIGGGARRDGGGNLAGPCPTPGLTHECIDACGNSGLQLCDDRNGTLQWSECGPLSGSLRCDGGVSGDGGPSDGAAMDGAIVEDAGADIDACVHDGDVGDASITDGGADFPEGTACMPEVRFCSTSSDCQWVMQGCDSATRVWGPCLNVGPNRCMSDAGPPDSGTSDSGTPTDGGTSCGCGDPFTILLCTTACGYPGARTCGDACADEPCRAILLGDPTVDGVCPGMDAGPADAGTCTCPPAGFCDAPCGDGWLTCDPTDCSTSCVPLSSACTDAGPTDAGPTDSGPMDAGPADAGVCACPGSGIECRNACGAVGSIVCTAAPACTPQCSIPLGAPCADAGPTDSGPVDSGPVDSGPADAGPTDAGPMDAGPTDSGPVDSGPADMGPTDSGPADMGPADTGPVDAGSATDAGSSGGSGTLTITASIPALDAAFGACTTGGWQVVLWDWSGVERDSAPGVATLTVTTPPLSGYRAVTVKCGSSYKAWPIASLTTPANSNGWITSILLDGVELADDEARVCHDVYSDPSGTDARFNRPMVPMASSIFRTCP